MAWNLREISAVRLVPEFRALLLVERGEDFVLLPAVGEVSEGYLAPRAERAIADASAGEVFVPGPPGQRGGRFFAGPVDRGQ